MRFSLPCPLFGARNRGGKLGEGAGSFRTVDEYAMRNCLIGTESEKSAHTMRFVARRVYIGYIAHSRVSTSVKSQRLITNRQIKK